MDLADSSCLSLSHGYFTAISGDPLRTGLRAWVGYGPGWVDCTVYCCLIHRVGTGPAILATVTLHVKLQGCIGWVPSYICADILPLSKRGT